MAKKDQVVDIPEKDENITEIDVSDEMRDVFHDPCLAIERCPCLRMRRMRSVCQVPSLQNASSEREETVNGG